MNSDHRENIGTHPALSDDPETALRARFDAAQRRKAEADDAYTTARNNLRVFLAARADEGPDMDTGANGRADFRRSESALYMPSVCSACRDKGSACRDKGSACGL